MMIIILVLLAMAALFGLSGLRVADQFERGVVFRLGKLHRLCGPGLYWLIPFLEWQTMVTEVGDEQNTTTIIMMPSEFVSMAGGIAELARQSARQTEQTASKA